MRDMREVKPMKNHKAKITIPNPFEKTGNLRIPKQYLDYLYKHADIQLGEDASGWSQEIITTFNIQHPVIAKSGVKPFLSHSRKDWAQGCSIGAVTITMKGRALIFPVIIRYSKLAPFDVYYDQSDHRWHFTANDTDDQFAQEGSVLQNISPAKPGDADGENMKRWRGIFGYNDRGTEIGFVRSAAKLAALGDKNKIEDILKWASSHKDRVVYGSDYALSVITSASDAKGIAPEDAIKTAAVDYSFFDFLLVKRAGLNRYEVSAGRQGFGEYLHNTMTSRVLRNTLEQFKPDLPKEAQEKILDNVDATAPQARIISKIDISQESGTLPDADLMEQTNRAVLSYGTFHVMQTNGEPASGLVIPIVDWDTSDTGMFLFLGRDAWSMQRSFSGRRSATELIPPEGRMIPGRRGVFVYRHSGMAFCLPPIEIRYNVMSPTGTSIRGVDLGTHQELNLVVRGDANSVIPFSIDTAPGDYVPGAVNMFIPSTMIFTPLPEMRTKLADFQKVGDLATKYREYALGGPSGRLSRDFGVGRMNFLAPSHDWIQLPEDLRKAGEIRKIGCRTNDPAELFFHMGIAAIPQPQAALEEARKQGSIAVQAMDLNKTASVQSYMQKLGQRMEQAVEKAKLEKLALQARDSVQVSDLMTIASAVDAMLGDPLGKEAFEAISSSLPSDIGTTKIAVETKDMTPNLDAMFDLNLLSEENVSFILDKAQMLPDVEDFFAKFLVMARIVGMGGEEEAIINVLEGLGAVKEALRTMGFRLRR